MNQNTEKQVYRIGELLISSGLVTAEKLSIALQKQLVTGEMLGEILVRLGIVSEFDFARILAHQKGIDFFDIDENTLPSKDALSLFNQQFCLHRAFLPLEIKGNLIIVIVGNSDIEQTVQEVARRTGLNCKVIQGEFSKVQQAIKHFFYFFENPLDSLFAKEIRKLNMDKDQVLSPDNLINYLLHLAVKYRATDVHIQPEQKSIHISFRVDGVLRPIIAMPIELKRVIVTVKINSKMDISDVFRPQDGSFSTSILDTAYDVRVSTIITEYGENLVMRLLPHGMHVKGLSQLGFFEEDLTQVNALFSNPHGIMLMTGPTGSGKSTTLHAGLRCEGMVGKNILTVEDPIEYKLPIINQTQVNRKAGYEFDSAIRHFLRHDPDVILVGEIRDTETANAAIKAAETGHLVLSTLHVNNVLGVVSRLGALNIPAQVVADTLVGVINQRLARKICNHCKESYVPDTHEQKLFTTPVTLLHRGKGCRHCMGTGYLGRFPIYEILTITPALSEMIAFGASRHQLFAKILEQGFISMESMALERVKEGVTTLVEIKRLLGNSVMESK